MKVSIVTTCKGRLHHLKQTVPSMLEVDFGCDHEVIVVDYGDQQHSGQFFKRFGHEKSDKLVVVEVFDDVEYFQPSRARNCGGQTASGDILCFIDGDVFLTQTWADTVYNSLVMDFAQLLVFPLGPMSAEKFGSCAVTAEAYHNVRGYDEALLNWGKQDQDFYQRVSRGHTVQNIDPALVNVIHNTNEERVRHYQDKRIAAYGKPASNDDNDKIIQDPDREVNPEGYGKFNGKITHRR